MSPFRERGRETIKPDAIFYNANVITMDPARPRASSVAVRGEYIVVVGDDRLAEESAGRKVDCRGKALLPGFHDAHCHIVSLANSLINLDCSPQSVHSIAEIKSLIAGTAQTLPPGQWIVGENYDEFRLEEKRHPDRRDLDAATRVHPVRLNHRSRHAFVLNSRAMELAGISGESEDPPGALIEREAETGEPAGLMFEMARYLKNAPPPDPDRVSQGMGLANQRCLSAGITSVQEAGSNNDLRQWRLLQHVKSSGAFAPRVTMMAGRDALPELAGQRMMPGYGDLNLRLGCLKVMLDRTTGRLYPSQVELEEIALKAHRRGFQMAIHAIEAEDIEAAVTAIERVASACGGSLPVENAPVAQASPPVENAPVAQASPPVGVVSRVGRRKEPNELKEPREPMFRHRIEHCSVCPDNLVDRIKAAGIVVVTQPAFIHYSGDRYLAKVPQQYQPFLYRIGTLVNRGIPVAAGSDAPVVPNDPLTGICAAVTRTSRSGQNLLPGEAVGVEQALSLYTAYAAYSACEESYKGTLSPGKLADMVLLDRDPTAVQPEELKDIRVVMTIIGGQVRWQSAAGD